ncbi:MAG: HAD-IA family hydrolase [Planctomycetota bacterium]
MSEIARPDLVIFDCDGVLVETERITLRVIADWVDSLGVPMTAEDAARKYKGRDIEVIKAEVEAEIGREVPDFVSGYRSRMFEAFEAGIEPIPGAVDAIDAIERAGLAWCVASNGPQIKMQASLSSAGLMERVGGLDRSTGSKVFSAYDVGKWKPEPDLFLFAARECGFDADRCVVVEDSTSGVEAALRAGMPCIAYADITSAESLEAAGATVVVTSMADVPTVFGVGAMGSRQ